MAEALSGTAQFAIGAALETSLAKDLKLGPKLANLAEFGGYFMVKRGIFAKVDSPCVRLFTDVSYRFKMIIGKYSGN